MLSCSKDIVKQSSTSITPIDLGVFAGSGAVHLCCTYVWLCDPSYGHCDGEGDGPAAGNDHHVRTSCAILVCLVVSSRKVSTNRCVQLCELLGSLLSAYQYSCWASFTHLAAHFEWIEVDGKEGNT
jgi:hypothetical protein